MIIIIIILIIIIIIIIIKTLITEDAFLTIVNLPSGPQNTKQIQEEQL